ncbi:hypothetical protein N9383_01530 [Granulosicoccus sp.]|nr:hypothetical protein [Granulosicoccus sp.]
MPLKSTLPATHLLRQYLLFVFTVVFLLTMTRSVYALWKFSELEETGAFVALFVQGLRFDLALIGFICLVPVVLGSLLSMFKVTRGLAKFIISLFLIMGLGIILLLEFVTPWFIHTQGIRPDVPVFQALESPLAVIQSAIVENAIAAAVLGVLGLLILLAFWSRMELSRFLRYRISRPAALATALIGGVLCILAIWSTPDVRQPPFGPTNAKISENETINDLAMNTTGKTIYSLLPPYLSSDE